MKPIEIATVDIYRARFAPAVLLNAGFVFHTASEHLIGLPEDAALAVFEQEKKK